MRRILIAVLLLCGLVAVITFYRHGRSLWHPVLVRVKGKRTVADVLEKYGQAAEARLKPCFRKANASYPPERAKFVILKQEERVELWVKAGRRWTLIRDYAVLGASGGPGPKLREGDWQVPEGVYRIMGLNPNSSYHLSIKLDYPNAFDRQKGREDGRQDLGCDIFIHGKTVSIGCVAIGDKPIEELFVMVARMGRSNAKVVIAPNDIRSAAPMQDPDVTVPWLGELYDMIRQELQDCPRPQESAP